MTRVQEITEAIRLLTPEELVERQAWMDEHLGGSPFAARIEADLATGRLDRAMHTALEDEKHGRTRPL